MSRERVKQIIGICMGLLVVGTVIHVSLSPSQFLSTADDTTPSIRIINTQSYPKTGGEWTVQFVVKGTADLYINGVQGTTWTQSQCSACDLEFLSITNESKMFQIVWMENGLIIKNFSSSTMIQENSKVLTLGKHVLEFRFGKQIVYASNDASDWWDGSWGYRKLISFNKSQVSGTLVDFPVLISCVDGDLDQKADADGHDIVFVSYQDNTTICPHELESYSNGALTAWVRVPRLLSSASSKLWMYYGNSEAMNQENATGVWDEDYVGVWHLQNGFNDSTSYCNNGTMIGLPTVVSGIIANGYSFDGNQDAVNISHDLSLRIDDYTIECWIDAASVQSSWAGIIGKHYVSNNEYMLQLDGQGDDVIIYHAGSSWDSNIDLTEIDDTWTYLLLTRDGSTETSYLNGIQRIQSTFTTDPDQTHDGNLTFCQERTGIGFNTSLDEIRISSIARNASWIKTTFNTIQNTSVFFQFGSEESAAPFLSDPYPSDGNEYVPKTPDFFMVTVFDPNPDRLNITWRTNQSGTWVTFNVTDGGGNGVDDGSYQVYNTSWVSIYDQIYWWSVNVSDGSQWTNETYQFIMHQFSPEINTFDLVNSSGSKLNNQTGLVHVNLEYIFSVNVTDKNGWEDVDFINISCWYDQGDELSTYNQTAGGNVNLYVQYENTTGSGMFRLCWPDDEASLCLLNCSEQRINDTTCLINMSFIPGNQTRCATSNETWTDTEGMFDDPFSWNLKCVVVDSFSNMISYENEFGVDYYSAIRAPDFVEIIGAPGMIEQSNVFTIDFISNADYTLMIYFDENLSQIGGSDIIGIGGNLSVLENTNSEDDIFVNTTFAGTGVSNAITVFDGREAPVNGTMNSVDVQFELFIPFGTWGTYSSSVIKKIQRVD
jgi:hypothetical protein